MKPTNVELTFERETLPKYVLRMGTVPNDVFRMGAG